MKVRMLVRTSDDGPDTGDVVEVSKKEAERLIGIGHAAPVEGETSIFDGKVADIVAWVDGDPARARQALEAESDRDTPRQTLIDQLEQVSAADGGTD